MAVEFGVEGMILDVAPGLEGGGLLAHERAMAFEPVLAKLLGRQAGMLSDAVNKFHHKSCARDWLENRPDTTG